jgi:hypothetical protein
MNTHESGPLLFVMAASAIDPVGKKASLLRRSFPTARGFAAERAKDGKRMSRICALRRENLH